jgi:anti-sigma B factor antagonist
VDSEAQNATIRQLAMPEIVHLPEEIDIANARTVGDELVAAIGDGTGVVIAEMTATVFCDSQCILHLLRANDRAAEAGAELRLVIDSDLVLRVLRITGVDCLLSIYSSLDAALTNAIRQQPAADPSLQG